MAGCNAARTDRRRQARADLTPGYSLYLDVVRCVAALAVFLEHVASYPFSRTTPTSTHPLLAFFGIYGNSAVIVFFVLSGYVIAYVVGTRERTAWAYSANRISRLYSVVLPALVLTFAFDALGQWLNPGFYSIRTVLWKPASWEGYLSSLFFVNEFQVFDLSGAVPGTNAPFWSLSFEATYYIVAGLVLFARCATRCRSPSCYSGSPAAPLPRCCRSGGSDSGFTRPALVWLNGCPLRARFWCCLRWQSWHSRRSPPS